MPKHAMLTYLMTTTLIATAGGFAQADKKIYPATFCQPSNRQHNFCLGTSRWGYIINHCRFDVPVVCPLVRDQASSDERFINIRVFYDTDEDFTCSFKSTNMSMDPEDPRQFGECEFELPHDRYELSVIRNVNEDEHCHGKRLPGSNPDIPRYWQSLHAYTLACNLPHETELGHYLAEEPNN